MTPATLQTRDGGLGRANAPGEICLRQLCCRAGAHQRFDQPELIIDLRVLLPELRVLHEALLQILQSPSKYHLLHTLPGGRERPPRCLSRLLRKHMQNHDPPFRRRHVDPSGDSSLGSNPQLPELAVEMLDVRRAKCPQTDVLYRLKQTDQPRAQLHRRRSLSSWFTVAQPDRWQDDQGHGEPAERTGLDPL